MSYLKNKIDYSAEAVLKELKKDRDRLIKIWGEDLYKDRLLKLEEYINEKRKKESNSTHSK